MDILDIVDGDLVVTQSPRSGNADYYLENGILKANAGFTGSITATADFNPEAQYKVINFYYDHNGLRTRKEVWDHGVTEGIRFSSGQSLWSTIVVSVSLSSFRHSKKNGFFHTGNISKEKFKKLLSFTRESGNTQSHQMTGGQEND